MIRLSGISKRYGKSATKAVDRLDLEARDGEIFGFLGPNGAGKTTTIKILSGALRADEGTVSIDGIDMAADPLAAKARIGMVGDNPELFNRLKAYEYLNFVADVFRISSEDRKSRIETLSDRFALSDVLGSPIGGFSRGMKQKLCVVASLLSDPSDWVLDEPMVGLDPQAAFDLKETMRERTQAGKCVFFSTHVMEVAEHICDRLAIINKGRILFSGSLDELREFRGRDSKAESLENLFLELVDDENRENRETDEKGEKDAAARGKA
ncbi:MAG: ABC transporter ATP-binding protein [Rectinemataceae bacterium]